MKRITVNGKTYAGKTELDVVWQVLRDQAA